MHKIEIELDANGLEYVTRMSRAMNCSIIEFIQGSMNGANDFIKNIPDSNLINFAVNTEKMITRLNTNN